MRLSIFITVCFALAACTPASHQSVEMEAPPWGWTEVTADLPGFAGPGQTVIATPDDARELHHYVETNATETTRAVFVTVYERPSLANRASRRLHFGDVPHTANVMETTSFERVDPVSLGLTGAFMQNAEAAYTIDDAERGETGLAVRRCWEDLCAEAMAYGADAGFSGSETHHADLLQALTIRR